MKKLIIIIIVILVLIVPSAFSADNPGIGSKIIRAIPDSLMTGYAGFTGIMYPIIHFEGEPVIGFVHAAATIPWIIGNTQLLWHNFNPNSTPLQKKIARSRQFLWQLGALGVYTAYYFAAVAGLDPYYDGFYGRQTLVYRIFPIAINMLITAIRLPGEAD
jgi:hypothetical protein